MQFSIRPVQLCVSLSIALLGCFHANAQIRLHGVSEYFTESDTLGIAKGDFNGDGHTDLVLAGCSGFCLLLGNADGTFQPEQSIGSLPFVFSIATADFNRDGHLDVAVGFENGIAIFLGKGDGTFSPALTAGFSSNVLSIAVGDFNHDGIPDLVAANGSIFTADAAFGVGDGTFQSLVNLGPGSAVAAGDLNRDGNSDIVVIDIGPPFKNNVVVFLSNGHGGFSESSRYTAGSSPFAATIADLNHDGNPDLVVAARDSSALDVFLGNGDGTFAPLVAYGVGFSPVAVVAADFNNDGTIDLMSGNESDGTLTLLSGNGDGTFAFAASYGIGVSPSGIVAGHFRSDQQLDVAISDSFNFAMDVLLNGPAGFTTAALIPLPSRPYSAAVTDVNDDGFSDVLIPVNGSNVIAVVFGHPEQGPQTRTLVPVAQPTYVIPADVNNDGHKDLIVAGGAGTSIALGNGDGTFQTPVSYGLNGNCMNTSYDIPLGCLAAGDFNNDGNIDIAGAGVFGSTVNLLLGNGDGTFRSGPSVGGLASPQFVAVGDLNHDGNLDLIVSQFGGGIVILLGHGDGTFGSARNIQVGFNPGQIVVADLNHDGIPDLVVGDDGVGSGESLGVYILLGKGNGTFHTPVAIQTQISPLTVGVVDLDGDGNLDLIAANYDSNNISVYRGNGDGTFGIEQIYAVGDAPDAVAFGDFTGDGRPDVVISNQFSNNVSVLSNLSPR